MCFRFIGGGGTPYAIQNVLPIIFNMQIKKYIFRHTSLGSAPSMFVTTALGAEEKVIDKNEKLSAFSNNLTRYIFATNWLFLILSLASFFFKIFFKKIENEKNQNSSLVGWFLLVILWNYGYPLASPFLDVLVAVILSIVNILAIKILIKK